MKDDQLQQLNINCIYFLKLRKFKKRESSIEQLGGLDVVCGVLQAKPDMIMRYSTADLLPRKQKKYLSLKEAKMGQHTICKSVMPFLN